MKTFMRFIDIDGDPVLIDTDKVSYVTNNGEETVIVVGKDAIRVANAFDEVVDAMTRNSEIINLSTWRRK